MPLKFFVSIYITFYLNLHYWDRAWEGCQREVNDERVMLVLYPPRCPTVTCIPWGDILADSSGLGRPFDPIARVLLLVILIILIILLYVL